jgi:hypothetical protein
MRGIFKFDRRQEEERLRLAEELIRRVDPGPYEDPNYLALLAFQAASIEMCLRSLSGERTNEPWSRFLRAPHIRPTSTRSRRFSRRSNMSSS